LTDCRIPSGVTFLQWYPSKLVASLSQIETVGKL